MGKRKFTKLFSSFLAFLMVISIVLPVSATELGTTDQKPFKQQQQNERNMLLKAAIAEQLEAAEGLPKLHKELEGKSGNELVPIIVHLSENPVALEKGIGDLKGKALSNSKLSEIRSKVKRQQADVDKAMRVKGILFEKGFTYDTVLNGFAAKVKADDLQKLLDITGITLVEPDTEVHATNEKPADSTSDLEKVGDFEAKMNTSISFLGIEKVWDEGYKGKGVKVAVLDTGIDPDHPEFQGIYKGGKNFIPNSSTYARERSDDDARETSPKDRPASQPEFNADGRSFYTDHGTHVAGTIAAIGANEYGIEGIAPEVDLYAYRVLGAYGSGSTSGIISAVEHAVNEKMDVINLSLGGGSNSENDSLSYAINNAMMAGVISVVSSGNSGPNRGTVTTPGTARLGIVVGNTTNPETQHNGLVTINVGEDYNYSKPLKFMGTTFGQDLAEQLDGEYELVSVPNVGAVSDYDGIDVDGKVALIARGELAFVDKIANAKANGAIAAIIHNFSGGTNAPDVSNVFLGDSFAFIPTIDMSVTDGTAIRDALKSGKGTVIFGNYSSEKSLGDDVNDSSSRGPSTPNFDIKPDVTAPGTNIMSSVPAYKWDFPEASYEESYDRFTGTSMAAPHIAGVAALVKQANPDWNAFDVKVAISNTAKLLNTSKYDVFVQGAGRVDAYAAAFPSVLAYAEDEAVLDGSGEIVPNIKGTVTFGPQKLDKDITVTKQIRVNDLNGAGGSFNVTVDVTKSFADANITIDNPSFTLAPNGEQLLNVTLTASKNTAAKAGDEILGYIHINGGQNHVSLPFAADFGGVPATQIMDMRITETDLSFNGDGVKDSAMLYFTITGDVGTNYIEIWNIEDPEGGAYGDGYIGYLHAGTSLGAGSYQLAINGEYRPWENSSTLTKIPDGLYTIDYTAQAAAGIIGDYVGPIVVKSTVPEIEGEVAENKLTGQVTDKYIDYNDVLKDYGLNYELNTKLKASYVITSDGKAGTAVPLTLNQDGSFEIDLTQDAEKVTVYVEDAAGNKGEAEFVYENTAEISLSVDQSDLTIEKGKTASVIVTQTTKDGDESTDEDVTAKATYTVADESIATAEAGVITAKAAGKTTVTISYGDNEVKVAVTVVDGEPGPEPEISLSVNPSEVKIEKGKTASVVVTQTTKDGDESTDEDVTAKATYTVADEAIATAEAGVITAKATGKTTVTISYGDNEVKVAVTVVDGEPDPEKTVSLKADKSLFLINVGATDKVKITEVTTIGDKVTEEDVTAKATYKMANEKIATVKEGVISGKSVGITEMTVTYGGNTVTIHIAIAQPDGERPVRPLP
ncbi:subtilisin family serine protease [Cytobacillus eiseniae]|uniref:Subtilisin family serine protease n=1 Tax=Cytobacillus eiseniae TaxID=762947 RepID=A0ABS4RF10_9BACI|nr:S8 family serine peptidase [Cytobacillus eiseniae]MBP2240945.1 subtilisin family serine protease [Cytobacillus eiseniae]